MVDEPLYGVFSAKPSAIVFGNVFGALPDIEWAQVYMFIVTSILSPQAMRKTQAQKPSLQRLDSHTKVSPYTYMG